LYLIFNEGYATTTGANLYRTELSAEAIRLCRAVHASMPEQPEVAGLLALMLLTDARRGARAGRTGELIPMAEQDRGLWNAAQIAEGVQLATHALQKRRPGPYQLQAAIAAVHDEAPSFEATDWPQIVALYEVLLDFGRNPVVELNHAVAVGMARGPLAGLELVEQLAGDPRLADDHRLFAVRAHLLEMAGHGSEAHHAYIAAAERALTVPHQRHLYARAARLRP
jgi:predicted RNA polymerase sigma factor